VEVALDAAAPGADESEIESAANGGAGEGNEAGDPFFRGFGADANGETFDDEGSEFFNELLFGDVLAEINASGGGSGEPELALLFVIAKIKTVKKAEALDEAQSDEGENASVGDDGNHSAEAEASAFKKSETLGIANQNSGDGVQPVDGHVAKVAKVGDVDAVFFREVTAEGFAIDFDGTKAAANAEAKEAREWSSQAHGI
jgi:hypothetical protein